MSTEAGSDSLSAILFKPFAKSDQELNSEVATSQMATMNELNDLDYYVTDTCKRFNVDLISLVNITDGKTTIVDTFKDQLTRAHFAIVVLTANRSAVHFEAGFARALGKPILFLANEGTDLSFYSRFENVLKYDLPLSPSFLETLKERIEQLVKEAKRPTVDISRMLGCLQVHFSELNVGEDLYSKLQATTANRFLEWAGSWTNCGPLRFRGSQNVLEAGICIMENLEEGGFATLYYPGHTSWVTDADQGAQDAYFSAAKRAVARGASIARVYILTDEIQAEEPAFRRMVRRDVLYGIDAKYIVIPNEELIQKPDIRDFALWDGELFVDVQYLSRSSQPPEIDYCDYYRRSSECSDPISKRKVQEAERWIADLQGDPRLKPAPALPSERSLLLEAWEGLQISTKEHCSASGYACESYHGAWQILRLLDVVSTPNWHADFYYEFFNRWYDEIQAREGSKYRPRVLVSGTADFAILYHLVQSIGKESAESCEFSILDRCYSPIEACIWLQRRLKSDGRMKIELTLSSKHQNLIGNKLKDANYDLITSDAFLSRDKSFNGNESAYSVQTVLEEWIRLLKPGGGIITTARVRRPGGQEIAPELRRAFESRCSAAYDEIHEYIRDGGPSRQQVLDAVNVYSKYIESCPFANEAELKELLASYSRQLEAWGSTSENPEAPCFVVQELTRYEMIKRPLYARIAVRKKSN